MIKGGWVYIMTNRYNRVFYIGPTADIAARVHQHRDGTGASFCKRYNLTKLVLAEPYPLIEEAIAREKAMKAWKREWKIAAIEKANPEWRDLFETIL